MEVTHSGTSLPKATCSACGAVLAVTGREETEVEFSTDVSEKTEKTRIVISVQRCDCAGQGEHINLIFGELDEMPEQPTK